MSGYVGRSQLVWSRRKPSGGKESEAQDSIPGGNGVGGPGPFIVPPKRFQRGERELSKYVRKGHGVRTIYRIWPQVGKDWRKSLPRDRQDLGISGKDAERGRAQEKGMMAMGGLFERYMGSNRKGNFED